MVLYSDEALDKADVSASRMKELIEQEIKDSNKVLANSGLGDLELNLVKTIKVSNFAIVISSRVSYIG